MVYIHAVTRHWTSVYQGYWQPYCQHTRQNTASHSSTEFRKLPKHNSVLV